MGEVLGFSNLSGTQVALQTKNLLPYITAHKMYTTLIQTLSPQSTQQIINNFRVQYLIINETLLFVFSTLTENPFLSLDSLYKLRNLLQSVSKEFRNEALFKKAVDLNYSLEDILNGFDPSARVNPKCQIFTLSKPFQSFYSSTSNLMYMNKPWKSEGNANSSALLKANTQLGLEKDLVSWTISLPNIQEQPRPQVHPFAGQFIDNIPVVQKSTKIQTKERISENSASNSRKSVGTPLASTCKLVIMEKVFVAFQNTKITNLRVVGQIGIELSAKTEGAGQVKINLLDWSDSRKIGKRTCNEHLKEIDDFTYEINIVKLKGTSAIIEYMVSPNIIELSNFPIYALYSLVYEDNYWVVQLKYQVSNSWKANLEDVVFIVMVNSSEIKLVEANSRGELIGNSLQWKASRLTNGQKGILEARLECKECRIDHAKLQLKSTGTNLSQLSANFEMNSVTEEALVRFMAEIVISNA